MRESYQSLNDKLQRAIGEESRLRWEHRRARDKMMELKTRVRESAQGESERLWREMEKAKSREEGLSLIRRITELGEKVEITPTTDNRLVVVRDGKSTEPDWLKETQEVAERR